MRCLMLIAGAAALLGPSLASAQAFERSFESAPGAIPTFGFAPPAKPRLTQWEAQQLVQVQRWAAVGKCVAAQDRDASVAYVVAARKSVAAQEAAQHLAPAFESCFAGSQIADMANDRYRRAAIADALGIAAGQS